MRPLRLALVFAAGVTAGCMASGPLTTAQPTPPTDRGPLGSPFAERHDFAASLETPLLIDRTDMRIGTTAQFNRLPTAAELADLRNLPALAHVVISLPGWPAEYEPLQVLNQVPQETDVVVVLPGWPPSRAATEAWNYVSARLRVVAVVPEPPPSSAVVADMNAMRGLERVIAQMDQPTRFGFERLQRPLSFRKVYE